MKYFFLLLIFSGISCTSSSNQNMSASSSDTQMSKSVYVGTYTRKEGHVDGKAQGIYRLQLDADKEVFKKEEVASIINPSFLTLDKVNGVLYAVSETGPNDGDEGLVYGLKLSQQGKLEKIDSAGTGGFAPCHVQVNAQGNQVVVSNYVGGAVSVYAADQGKLTLIQQIDLVGSGSHPRQESAHTHMSIWSPDEQYLYVADLGSNVIWNFRWDDKSNTYLPNTAQFQLVLDEASGPRHMDFHPNGQWMAVINELANTINMLSYDQANGVLSIIDTIRTLPPEGDITANNTADIHFHPNGKFLYGSNRGINEQGINTLAVFEVSQSGELSMVQQESTRGAIPRNFAIAEDGQSLWVANQNSDNIVRFNIDSATGRLSFASEIKDVMTPVCIQGL